jgi:uncharacterized membrane protein
MGTGEIILIVLLLTCGSFVGLGVPLFLGRISPNSTYGYRTPQTLRDPQAWLRANRACGYWTITTGVIASGVAAGTYAARLTIGWQAFVTLATIGCGTIIMAAASDAAARQPNDSPVKTRRQFRLLTLFVITTIVAIACAIVRLPVPWVFKSGLLWAYFICVIGLALRNFNASASRQD